MPRSSRMPQDPVYNNQNRLTALTRELHDLHERVAAGEGQAAETLDGIQWELQNLMFAICQPQPPVPAEPLREVIQQYTNTLCSMQKQSILTNSLLQDISVFNEHDSTKLEDWFTDIKTTADLTSESRARLAKAKSWALRCTLLTEAINSNKSWDDMKDLLQLKLCNADMHTYTSQFMEIQQQEKEPLTANVHQFKTEARSCNFTNDAATIHIFIKDLKNAHSLATHIYEKGPQMLNDMIYEFKKLNGCNS